MLRIHEVKRNIEKRSILLQEQILKKIGIKGLELSEYQIVKESVDARNKAEIKLVYSVDFIPSLVGQNAEELEEQLLDKCKGIKLEKSPDMHYHAVTKGQEVLKHRPVITGFGPCGMFAGLILSEMGYEPYYYRKRKVH